MPLSAARLSASRAAGRLPALSALRPARSASAGGVSRLMVFPKAGPAMLVATTISAQASALDIRIGHRFRITARVGNGAVPRRAHPLGVLPQRAAPESVQVRLPRFATRGERRFVETDVERAR